MDNIDNALLHRINYIEKVCTGITRIREAVSDHGGTDLELRYNDFFTVSFQIKTATPQVTGQVIKLLSVMRGEMYREDLQYALGLSDRKNFRHIYIKPALEDGLIEMTIPEKPNSRLQQYRLTAKGRALLEGESRDE